MSTYQKYQKPKQLTAGNGNVQAGTQVPPNSVDAEKAVLAAMLVDRNSIPKVIEIIDSESFYNQGNKVIFEAAINLFNRSENVDFITLADELRKNGTFEISGGLQCLIGLNSHLPSAGNVQKYALIVKEKYLRRKLIATGHNIVANGFDETADVLDEIDLAESKIFEIASSRFHKSYVGIDQVARDSFNLIEKLTNRTEDLTGIPSGLQELDRLTCGFQNSDLIIIAGRTSMGKTALGLSIAKYTAIERDIPTAIFSIEMSAVQLGIRLISAEAKIDQQKLRSGRVSNDNMRKMVTALGRISRSPMVIDDSAKLTITELRAKCRRLVSEHKVKLILIDYLQLIDIKSKMQSREQEVSNITKSLKQVAKELNLPVIVLAQLNRSVETRADKRPILSDLRESGSIEQDADVVIFVNRPEYYGKKTYDDGAQTEGTAELIVAKQRNGPLGTVRTAYLKEYTLFMNLEKSFVNESLYDKYENHPDDNDSGF